MRESLILKKLLVFFFFCFTLTNLRGQITSPGDTTGCVPFTVTFTSVLPGDWDFGDGGGGAQNKSSATNIFTSPGTYEVILVGVDTITVEVFDLPTADFSSPDNSGCVVFGASFTDLSSAKNGAIIDKWEWTYGDGGSGNIQNPTYNYTIAGSYDVILKITDNKGCIATEKKDKYITATTPPNVSFTSTSGFTACSAPFDVVLSNSSTSSSGGTSGLTYLWEFGDGGTSTSQNPTHTYTAEGTYNLKLTVTEDGCEVSDIEGVTIGKPVPIISGPDSVCLGSSFTFINGTVSNYNWSWNVDGTFLSKGKNPNHTLNVAGDHEVMLIATSSSGCSDSIKRNIFVQEIDAQFDFNPTYFCKNNNPYCVDFSDASIANSSITSWTWLFGDGGFSSAQNPQHCYYTDTNIYTVYDPIYYLTTLSVRSSAGCEDEIVHTDTIFPISAFFSPDSSEGCAPLVVTFSDSTRSRETIVKWNYDFGDGNSSTSQNPTHTYTTPGEYWVTLISENDIGCIDTSFKVLIKVGKGLSLDFSIDDNTLCLGDTVKFTNTSTDPEIDSVDFWHYQTDFGKSSHGCILEDDQAWTYFDEIGQHDVTMMANFNGCISEKTITNAVTVDGPSSKFFFTGNCSTPMNYSFDGRVLGATSWTWDYGDGNTSNHSNLADTIQSHAFASTGDYWVKLISENNSSGCKNDTDSTLVHVRNIQAVITGDSVICSGLNYTFSSGSSVDVYQSCNDGFRWDLGEKTPPDQNGDTLKTFNFSNPSLDTIRLIAYDINHCKDTVSYPIRITNIQARIGYDTLNGCLPLTINLSDSTVSDTLITKWEWYHHHRKDYSFVNIGTTKDVSHIFTGSESFPDTIILIVTDSLGCSSSDTVEVNRIVPNPVFTNLTGRNICKGDSVSVRPKDLNGLASWQWDVGNGVTLSNVEEPNLIVDSIGHFELQLIVTDTNGCIDSSTVSNYIHVQGYPSAGFVALNENGENIDTLPVICYNQQIDFTDTSLADVFKSRSWDLATGNPVVSNSTVSWIYDSVGTYDVQIAIETTYGCKDTATKSLTFVGPVADIEMSDSIICVGDVVSFTMKDTTDIFNFEWNFGDGDTSIIGSPSHQYITLPIGGKTLVKLLVQAPISNGISCNYVAEDTLYVHEVEAAFGYADSVFCDGIDAAFADSSVGNVTYQWDYGNGNTSTDAIPEIQKYYPGNYTVRLIVFNAESGCIDTADSNITVHDVPNVSVNDASFCLGNSANLIAKGALTYSWSPSTELNTSTGDTVVITPTVEDVITVVGVDTNGCYSEAESQIIVMQPQFNTDIDTCIFIGEPFSVGVDDESPLFTYDWSTGETKYLNCLTCSQNFVDASNQVGDDTLKYILNYSDSMGCFFNTAIFNICIKESFTYDVPTAFTPDGDGINDIIYVEGHGIEKINFFKIYNRWGEVVFETTDINEGWDGIYKGEQQSMESFVYKASVVFFNGKEEAKSGTITLIR